MVCSLPRLVTTGDNVLEMSISLVFLSTGLVPVHEYQMVTAVLLMKLFCLCLNPVSNETGNGRVMQISARELCLKQTSGLFKNRLS